MNPQVAPEKTKKLTAAEAFVAYKEHHPLTFSVTAKFDDDHITAATNLSKEKSIASAIERYKKQPNILRSSWILVDHNTLQNKAAGATKVPCVHQGAQQMAIAIKVKRRTVTIDAFTKRELQGDNLSKYTKVGEHYLSCKSEEKDVTLAVKGPYDPMTGAVELYHYEEGALPAAAMVDKYLVWVVDDKDELIRPQAKK